MNHFIVFLFLFLSLHAHAGLNNSFFEVAGGYPFDLMITNPDDSKAYYDGAAFKAQFNYNFSDNRTDMAYGLSVHYKYLNLENTKSGSVKESANHKMFGLGFFMKASRFFAGVNYSFAKAEHESTGLVNALDAFKYNPLTLDIAYTVPYGNLLEIGPAYSYTMATLSSDETGLSKDADYKEQIVWIKLVFFFR